MHIARPIYIFIMLVYIEYIRFKTVEVNPI